ncbi:MAG TPA: tRNA (guanosine(46)-N7)-methyltransferase TrmB [Chthoniobacterales bacterium]|nr:tRNA (guanosine(46)-N7)-methyltransferase TrmB [Chthoniobacterales bacterium]
MAELVLDTYLAPLDLLAIFGRTAPLHVDLGCGDGSFLCELARRNPEGNFLGIDKLAGRVAKACRKSAQLENVRVLKVETSYAVRYLLRENAVEAFYLFFPDPWPKRRHHRRRIVTLDFLKSIQAALSRRGMLHIATDELEYFLHIQQVVAELDRLNQSSLEIVQHDNPGLPETRFERRFIDAGAAIYRLSLRKISPVANALARQVSG